jgi:hypothetical protein
LLVSNCDQIKGEIYVSFAKYYATVDEVSDVLDDGDFGILQEGYECPVCTFFIIELDAFFGQMEVFIRRWTSIDAPDFLGS